MAGSISEALKPASLSFMVTGMALGMAMVARAVVAALALVAIVALKPGRLLWTVLATVGVIVSASFAWTGHGAATEGPGALLHLTATMIHAVSAALWLGALAGGEDPRQALRRLRLNIMKETLVGAVLLAVVAVSGLC